MEDAQSLKLERSASSEDARAFQAIFDAHFERLFRYLHRVSGERELAADLAQEAFARLYQRRETPDAPGAWLVSVALNLFRNARSMRRRRKALLTEERAGISLGVPPPSPMQEAEREGTRLLVRAALDRMRERDRHLLLLQAEGYSYREIALALSLHEASVGALLARARQAFKDHYREPDDAS